MWRVPRSGSPGVSERERDGIRFCIYCCTARSDDKGTKRKEKDSQRNDLKFDSRFHFSLRLRLAEPVCYTCILVYLYTCILVCIFRRGSFRLEEEGELRNTKSICEQARRWL